MGVGRLASAATWKRRPRVCWLDEGVECFFLFNAPHVKLQTDRLAGHLAEFDGGSVPKQGGDRPDVLVLGLGFRVARLGSLPARDAEPVIRTSICLSLSLSVSILASYVPLVSCALCCHHPFVLLSPSLLLTADLVWTLPSPTARAPSVLLSCSCSSLLDSFASACPATPRPPRPSFSPPCAPRYSTPPSLIQLTRPQCSLPLLYILDNVHAI